MNRRAISPPPASSEVDRRFIPVLSLIFLLALAFYFYTLQPSLAWGDGVKVQLETISGESFIQSVLPGELFADDPLPFAKVGVAAWDHPLYVMLGHSLVRLFPHLHTPWLVNALSAVFGAAALTVCFALCYAQTRAYLAPLLAVLAIAVSHTFWFHSVTAEVYTLSVFLLLLSIYFVDRFERAGRLRFLVGGAFVLGLGVANHLMAVLAFPGFLIYFAVAGRTSLKEHLTPSRVLLAGLAFVAGCSPYLVQFARMLRVFSLSEAFGPVVGSVFLRELLATTPEILLSSALTYLMFLAYQFSPIGLIAGVFGFFQRGKETGGLWGKVLAFYLVYTVFGVFYRVSDQFAFFLTSHVFFGISIGLGLQALWLKLPAARRQGLYAACGLLTLALPFLYSRTPVLARSFGVTDEAFGIPQIGTGTRFGLAYYLDPNKRADTEAYEFGRDFFQRAPRDALIIAEWYADTDEYFILRYFAQVEARRPDIEIVGWPLEAPFTFDPRLAVRLVDEQVTERPVYLASLDETFYQASVLANRYCIVPELNLYRVYPARSGAPVAREGECQGG